MKRSIINDISLKKLYYDHTMSKNKLNVGCGTVIKEGWVNHDIVNLPGVDVVHDLRIFPWPFEDNQFEEILMKDVLEHLPDTIKTFEELYRITKKWAKVIIAVPYWNSIIAHADPTHVKHFNQFSFDFFDPTKDACTDRPYYTSARFKIQKMGLWVTPFEGIIPRKFTRDFLFHNSIVKKILFFMASFLNNIISGIELELERI